MSTHGTVVCNTLELTEGSGAKRIVNSEADPSNRGPWASCTKQMSTIHYWQSDNAKLSVKQANNKYTNKSKNN